MAPPINPALKNNFKRSSSIKGEHDSQTGASSGMNGPRSSSYSGRRQEQHPTTIVQLQNTAYPKILQDTN